jgi:hypothetical protein
LVGFLVILGFAVIVALEQLKIAPDIMNILFTAVVGAAALAFGLAFGLGGRDTARRLLERTEGNVEQVASSAAHQLEEQQTMSQAQATVRREAEQMRAHAADTPATPDTVVGQRTANNMRRPDNR